MISVSNDNEGKVIGYIEWRQVGQSGFDKLHGEYVWINDFWIHPDYRGGHVMVNLIEKILNIARQAKWCYFTRRKYDGRLSKLYSREKFMRLVDKLQVGV